MWLVFQTVIGTSGTLPTELKTKQMKNFGNFRLGDWLVCPDLDRITRGGMHVSLQPQVMDLLVYLAHHHDEVVSTEKLLSSLWKGRVVTTSSIYSSIKQLREALGDDVQNPSYIKTIPKRGYRLSARPVFLGEEEFKSLPVNLLVGEFPAPKGPLRWRRIALLALGLVLVLTASYLYHIQKHVNPVNPEDTSESFIGLSYSAEELYQQSLALIDRQDKPSLMSALVRLELVLKLNPDYADAHVAAARVYLELANFTGYYGQDWFKESRNLARPHLEKALAIEPDLAEAYALMGELPVQYEARRDAYEKALLLDPNLYRVHMKLGILVMDQMRPWTDALVHLERAVEIEPESIDAAVLLVLFLQWVPHRWEDAERIIANLTSQFPESRSLKRSRAEWFLIVKGQPSEAVPLLQDLIIFDPSDTWARSWLSKAWYMLGETGRAMESPVPSPHWRYVLAPDRMTSLKTMKEESRLNNEIDYGRRLVSAYVFTMLRDWQSAVDILAVDAIDLDAFSRSPHVQNFALNESPAMSLAVAYKNLGDQENYEKYAGLEREAVNIRTENGRLRNEPYSRAMARLNAMDGKPYEAMLELEHLILTGKIDPRDLLHPAFDDMRDDPAFERLETLQRQRINSERVKLGLAPLGG